MDGSGEVTTETLATSLCRNYSLIVCLSCKNNLRIMMHCLAVEKVIKVVVEGIVKEQLCECSGYIVIMLRVETSWN